MYDSGSLMCYRTLALEWVVEVLTFKCSYEECSLFLWKGIRRHTNSFRPSVPSFSNKQTSPKLHFILEMPFIEVSINDRTGRKIRVKCSPDDTIGDLKRMIALQIGTRPDRLILRKWNTSYQDNITLADYEIKDGMNLELYYQ